MKEEGKCVENFPRFLVKGDFCEMCFLFEWMGGGKWELSIMSVEYETGRII